ncbi:MAG: ABC transporter substrate-binding protein [Ktedonobacteraceae bacterium]
MRSHTSFARKLLLTCTCLTALLLSACGSNIGISKSAPSVPTATVEGTPKASYDQQVYHYSFIGSDLDIASFDPALTPDQNSAIVIQMVFTGLVQLDDNLQVQPQMAQSWEQSSDGLRWTFHLRPNLTFSDGTPLTSKDVAYSIDRALQKSLQSPTSSTYLALIKDSDKLYAGKLKTIIGDSLVTPDPNTIIILTNKKAAYFLYALTYPNSYVVEKRLIDKYGSKFTDHLTEGGGAGPFVVSQYLHKKEIDFTPNPYYYSLKPILQKVVYSFVKTTAAQYQAYQNGQLDVTGIPIDQLDAAKQRGNEYSQTPVLQTGYFAMNFLAKPFDNLHIRQAFALSLNREAINNAIYAGALIPTYHIIPQGMIGYNLNLVGPAGIKDSRGSPSTAKQLLQVGLQEEGWSSISQMPPIKLTYPKDPTNDKYISMAIQMWQSVLGVNVTPNPLDFNTFLTLEVKTQGNANGLQIWYINWVADYPDPQDWTTLQFDKGAVQNSMNYGQNSTADALQEQAIQQQLEQADAESNPATRIQLYDSAEQQLINQVAWIPMLQSTRHRLQKPYLTGIVLNPLEITPPNDWANIYIAAH